MSVILGVNGCIEFAGSRLKKGYGRTQWMGRQYLAHRVVYAINEGVAYLAMVHDVFGYWTLSKGGVEESESLEEGAVREIKE